MPAQSTSSKKPKPESASKPKAKPAAKPAKPKPAAPKQAAPIPAAPLTPDEERTWAMLAHLSVLLNMVTGFLGVVAALVIYLVYQTRSRYVAYQALQSLIFQSIVWIGGGLLLVGVWIVTSILLVFLVGILCLPVALLMSAFPVVGIVYGVIGGIECSHGRDFRYWLVGDWVRGTLTG
jgi:uncharacterized Tic20 family protein